MHLVTLHVNLKKILNNRNIILNFVFLLIHIYFTHYFTGFIVHIYIYIYIYIIYSIEIVLN